MPSPTYDQNKIHIYNWRAKHPAKNNEIQREYSKRYMRFQRECQRLRNILI